jgi:hypothetical protein
MYVRNCGYSKNNKRKHILYRGFDELQFILFSSLTIIAAKDD